MSKLADWRKTSETPRLVLHTKPGGVIQLSDAERMENNYRNIEVVCVGCGRRCIQEDNPEATGRNIAHWYRRQFKN